MTSYFYENQGELFGARKACGFGDDEFAVKCIDRAIANELIRRWHYSGKIYIASYLHLGVFRGGELQGVLQFGYAMNPRSQASVVKGTPIDGYMELNRMWVDDIAPRNSESRAISYAIKLIRARHPAVRWIQSFADERCGRGGVVYQACNFRYYGEHLSTFWKLDGEVYHNSLMTRTDGKGGPASTYLRANRDRAVAETYRQFRYIYFMKPRFARLCRLTEQPFPKIAASPEDEQDTILCEAGATPAGRSKQAYPKL